ncbi:PTS system ascorbate-specific IIA component [Rhodoglobus vestalii]|uniref:Ascorbate-specific PTS system EIIA component n=1 Tax=Rhodoglobus vestalii TaxID=193384 RepID=A0A8H2PXR0_9MICO|nr:PTS sugar transporter subunit IIA [Rhodoglobus vestalii]TQO19539.1 PTS system ascorbate-specific IIA component [Rhodoglobus vestalii]
MSRTLADELSDDAVILGAEAPDWRSAIRIAGDALTASGSTTDEYTAEMIRAVEELGPYIVIAPSIALAHSRPSPAVLKTGISWVSLAHPVEFGHAANDPVRLVVGLAAVDHDSHLTTMSNLAGVLSGDIDSLLEATNPEQLRALIRDNTQ